MYLQIRQVAGLYIGLAKVNINGKTECLYSGAQKSREAVIDRIFSLITL